MLDKLVCTYKGHDKDTVYTRVNQLCNLVRTRPTEDLFKKLCQALSYASLFVIPDYDLETNKAYTVENSCYYVDGIIKISYNIIVSEFYNMSVGRGKVVDSLKTILCDCAFGEVMSTMNLPTTVLFLTLLDYYVVLTGINFKYSSDDYWYTIQCNFMEVIGV